LDFSKVTEMEIPRYYAFDAFLFDASELRLTRDGRPVPIQPKVAELLLLLLRNRGQVIAKESLVESLWHSTHVTEANLNQTVYLLRKALGGDACVKTVKKRGYCFVAEVTERHARGGPDSPAQGEQGGVAQGVPAGRVEVSPGAGGSPLGGGAKPLARGASKGAALLWIAVACVLAAPLVYWLAAGKARAPEGSDNRHREGVV
jgi:DNA-binding winged helix-turn-helix (wHTH) protein